MLSDNLSEEGPHTLSCTIRRHMGGMHHLSQSIDKHNDSGVTTLCLAVQLLGSCVISVMRSRDTDDHVVRGIASGCSSLCGFSVELLFL